MSRRIAIAADHRPHLSGSGRACAVDNVNDNANDRPRMRVDD